MPTQTTPRLFDYGIAQEQSDIRAHVAVAMRTIFVFRTKIAAALLGRPHQYRLVSAGQPGVEGPTATGYLVPPGDIPGIRRIECCKDPRWWAHFTDERADTGAKGDAAVGVVVWLLRYGRFPLWVDADESEDRDIQRSGTDIIVCCKQRIQVKCDWHAGNPAKSGCLFLQVSERNPLKKV